MCWTSETGFCETLRDLWQWITGRRNTADSDRETWDHSDEEDIDDQVYDNPVSIDTSSRDTNVLESINNTMDLTRADSGENFCTPCASLGKRISADTYCTDCCEFLCESCVKYHKVLTVTKTHVLIGKEEIADNPPTVKKDRPTQLCPLHEDDVVKYYCPQHDTVGCQACITLDHRTCEGVVYIQQVSKHILETEEFQNFDAEVREIKTKADGILVELAENASGATECTNQAIEAVQEVRRKLNAAMDKLEADLRVKAELMGKAGRDKMQLVSDQVKAILEDTVSLINQLETFRSNEEKCNLYMVMKQAQGGLTKALQDKLKAVEDSTTIRLFNFQPNHDLLEMIRGKDGLGEMRLRIQTLEHHIDINVKSEKDSRECSITGSAMMPNCKLVVTDHTNKKIKLIDIKADKLVSEFELTSAPWDCTDIHDREVAVSLPNEKKIVLVKTYPELQLKGAIEMGDVCRGVAYDEDQLIVTFPEQNEIRIMDMDGVVSKTISTDGTGAALFDKPSYVCINPDTDLIYVSNWNNNTVVCLKLDGTVVSVFTHEQLQCPEQVVVDGNGLVYFCGCISHNIYQLSPDCKMLKIILTQTEGLRTPYSISYSTKTDRFYVGMKGNNVVKVYRAM